MKLKKFNEMWDPMGSWNPKQLDTDEITERPGYLLSDYSTTREEVKEELIKRMKGHKQLNYGDNAEIRAEQLLNIHKVWFERVLSTPNAINNLDSIVTSLIKSEENLRDGGPLSYRK